MLLAVILQHRTYFYIQLNGNVNRGKVLYKTKSQCHFCKTIRDAIYRNRLRWFDFNLYTFNLVSAHREYKQESMFPGPFSDKVVIIHPAKVLRYIATEIMQTTAIYRQIIIIHTKSQQTIHM